VEAAEKEDIRKVSAVYALATEGRALTSAAGGGVGAIV